MALFDHTVVSGIVMLIATSKPTLQMLQMLQIKPSVKKCDC